MTRTRKASRTAVAFGKRLLAARAEAGMRQEDLARLLKIGRATVANMEAGRHSPSMRVLHRLAHVLPAAVAGMLDARPRGAFGTERRKAPLTERRKATP